MRVTFVLKTAGMEGGVRVVAIYADALRRAGHEVTVVSTPTPVGSLTRRIKRGLKGEGFAGLRPRGPSHLDALDIEHRVLESARPVTAQDVPDADVVVATWWETAEWVAGFPDSKGRALYLIQHDERVFPFMSDDDRRRVEATWSLPMAKVAVAQWLSDLLVEHNCSPAEVIPNAVDPQRFRAEPRGKQAVPTVGMMYSPVSFKGADVMLDAVRRAQAEIPSLRLIAFGHDDPVPELPLPSNTTFRRNPSQDEIAGLYARCDAWLFGSRCEGFGLPILEAMACRTPVIGTPAGAAPELLAHGRGWLVPMEDPGAMAQAIGDVALLSPQAWSNVSDSAYAHATAYTWEQASARFVDFAIAQTRQTAARVG